MPKTLSTPVNSNISKPAKGATIGQNVAASLARIQRVPTAGGTGIIESR